jgi:hypothetical protein
LSQAIENPLLADLGPAPFRFKLKSSQALVAKAYTPVFRFLALALTGGCVFWLFLLWQQGLLAQSQNSGLLWLLSACALLSYTTWHIFRSRTTLSEQTIRQTWIWNKEMALRELAYVKLIRIPGLDWLIAPRLYCRTLLGKFAVFYCADRVLLAEFERLGKELRTFRGR